MAINQWDNNLLRTSARPASFGSRCSANLPQPPALSPLAPDRFHDIGILARGPTGDSPAAGVVELTEAISEGLGGLAGGKFRQPSAIPGSPDPLNLCPPQPP